MLFNNSAQWLAQQLRRIVKQLLCGGLLPPRIFISMFQ